MVRRLLIFIDCAIVNLLFLAPPGRALSAPLMMDVLLLRESDKRGFFTYFDVALALLLVATYFKWRKYSK